MPSFTEKRNCMETGMKKEQQGGGAVKGINEGQDCS